ncbi:hypothetical protein BDZ45DRAFT_742767 [Acephala macrosclerotiorum]|nr:hypothetical protein BDZ45DRAFT_742767 [Acephala macrosclerotiorum]
MVRATAIPSLAAMMTDVRARVSIAHGQSWTSSACWHTRKRASLGIRSSASSQAGLGLQYAHAGTWSGLESNSLPPADGQAVAQALCVSLSLGVCRDESLKGTLSFCRPVSSVFLILHNSGDEGYYPVCFISWEIEPWRLSWSG